MTSIGGRTEWLTNTHSLSTLPHLLFGVLQGSSAVEILLFFPRMMHRDPLRHFKVNRIPKTIQDYFWDHVLLPALSSVIPSTRSAYFPIDRSHSAFKLGSGKQSAKFSLPPEGLVKMVEQMRHIVRDFFTLKDLSNSMDWLGWNLREPETLWIFLFCGTNKRFQGHHTCTKERSQGQYECCSSTLQTVILWIGLGIYEEQKKGGIFL